MDRWIEEKWYSAYQVGLCYKNIGNLPSFEKWMNVAYMIRPGRAEPLHHLAQVFREKGEHYKSYHYIQLGRRIPESNDSLFVETYPYRGGFDYEASVIEYYVNPDRRVGLRSSVEYLLKQEAHAQNVLANMQFYVQPIRSTTRPLKVEVPFAPHFRPTVVSFMDGDRANVRFVNYLPPTDGDYRTPDGRQIRTENAYMDLSTGKVLTRMKDDIRHEQLVSGYEDLRLFRGPSGWKFFGSTCKTAINNHIQMMCGDYNLATGNLENSQVIESPTKAVWEKNWLPIQGTDHHIYGWRPFRVGTIVNGVWTSVREVPMPPMFGLFRGSAPPIQVGKGLLAMVHVAEYSMPRKYYHLFVELDPTNYIPQRISLPFVFRSASVEYCISMRAMNGKIECIATCMDADPHWVTIDPSDIEWVQLK